MRRDADAADPLQRKTKFAEPLEGEGSDPVTLFTDNEFVRQSLQGDSRFSLLDSHQNAMILWLDEAYEMRSFLSWGFNEADTYVSWFKKDAALTTKHNVAHLISSSLADQSCMPSTYFLDTHLACFIGDW